MQQPIIQLNKASVARAGRNLVSGVDWVVKPGEHWALLGSNGAGKSTLMRLARGDMPPTGGERTYCFDGQSQFTPIGVRRRMAMVSASLHEKYAGAGWRISGREAVLAGFFDAWLLYDEPTGAMREACEATLNRLGLLTLADKLVGEMSSGELRKIVVARALAPAPDLLFLDECMEGLDRPSRLSMLGVLERAGENAGLVVAAHRLDEIPGCVDRALLLSQGTVAACGSYGEIAAEYAGRPITSPITSPVTSPVASPVAAQHVATASRAFTCAVPAKDYSFLFSLENGAHTMLGTPILQGVDWTMRPGECWAVTGDNGAGKSTLLKLLLGLVDPMPETVIRWFGGSALPDMTEVRRRVGLVSTELQTGYGYDLSAKEVVWSGCFGSIGLYEEVTPAMRERAAEAMDFFGISALAERPISRLSTGQMRRVLLARAVAPGPALLLLDEPTAGLDQPSRILTLSLLQRLAEAGMPLVLITHHDDELIPAISHRLHLEQGRVGSIAAV